MRLAWHIAVTLCLLIATAGHAIAQTAAGAQRTSEEQATRRKLDVLRAEIKALGEQQRTMAGERSEAERDLRDKELALAKIAHDVRALDEKIAAQQAGLDDLGQQRERLETALRSQRESLAALLRSAYALGRNEELKLLLQQDDVASIARVLAYHRYFQRSQVGRIDALLADLQQLAEVQESIRQATAELTATRELHTAQSAALAAERAARAQRVVELDTKLKDQGARIVALGKDEAALNGLLEKLRDVFADIPAKLVGNVPFGSLRGKLAWPLRGKVVRGFGAKDESGRSSSGLLLASDAGTPVHAVSHGRVAFADWLRGYGLMLIIDHGDGYLSLYGCNETLLKDVGDWVAAGETIATSGASGGQKIPGLYFELRAKGAPVNPRGWLR